MTTSSIKLKFGGIEIEYEGDPAFLTNGLPDLLQTLKDLTPSVLLHQNAVDLDSNDHPPISVSDAQPVSPSSLPQLSLNTLAAHFDVKSGPDLIMTALAHLQVGTGKQSVSKKEIQTDIKTATSFYNANIMSNFGSSISGLVKNKRINQLGADSYALTASELKSAEAKIAAI
ncbi:hypothetical protein AB4Z25_05520 [Rhizobium sp. RAF36]|uniref:hypothetical protein n=1 Tax=Rhizobium sp. RAF36 TaxID=3233055 RepID=UPI0013AFC1AC